MQRSFDTLSRSFTQALLALVVAFLGAEPAHASSPQEDFRDKFEKAMKVGAKDEMAKLVRGNEWEAVEYIMDTCEVAANSPSERIYDRLDALKAAWKTSYDTDFVKNMEEYFSFLDPPSFRERFRLKNDYNTAVKNFLEAETEKEAGRGKLNALSRQFLEYAEAFETLGDKYLASNSWLYHSKCLDEWHQGPKADQKAVADAYRKLIKLREEIGLKDRFYRETVPILKRLEGLGFGESSEEGGEGGGPAASGSGASVTLEMAYEPLKKLDQYERPNYFLDDHYPIWDGLRFGRVDSTSKFIRMEDSPTFKRTGANKIEGDIDGDGEFEFKVPTRGRLDIVEIEIGTGKSKRPWAFFAQVGAQTDLYQGVELSNAASDDNWAVFSAPGSCMVATVGDSEIRVFDDDMDGIYGTRQENSGYGHVGLTQGFYQPEFDTIAVDGSKRAGPWSEYVQTKSGWFRLESQDGGATIIATPTELRTGKLKLKAKGAKPDFLIVKGANDFEHCYFDLAASKEVEVPIGRYTLYWGLVTKGKKKQQMKALIIPGKGAQAYDVPDGETVEVEIGAPYDFVCEYETAPDTVTVNGNSVAIVGVGGERYERIYGAVPRPDVSIRKEGAKRGSKGESMDIIQDRSGFDNKGGYAAMWKPLDLVVERRGGTGEVEVQLTEKKNKLFGKIEGSWR